MLIDCLLMGSWHDGVDKNWKRRVKIEVLFFGVLFVLAAFCGTVCGEDLERKIAQAVEDFKAKRYDKVLEFLKETKREGRNDGRYAGFLLNLNGAVLTKQKDFDGARAAFRAALEVEPGMFAANYNLHEVSLLAGDYQAAVDGFSEMLMRDPSNELLSFKVFLSQLLAGDEAAAQTTLRRMPMGRLTPAWYFAKAAWFYVKKDRGRSQRYVDRARLFFPDKLEIYEESFRDLGWKIK